MKWLTFSFRHDQSIDAAKRTVCSWKQTSVTVCAVHREPPPHGWIFFSCIFELISIIYNISEANEKSWHKQRQSAPIRHQWDKQRPFGATGLRWPRTEETLPSCAWVSTVWCVSLLFENGHIGNERVTGNQGRDLRCQIVITRFLGGQMTFGRYNHRARNTDRTALCVIIELLMKINDY